jgi:hypothetical protein
MGRIYYPFGQQAQRDHTDGQLGSNRDCVIAGKESSSGEATLLQGCCGASERRHTIMKKQTH